MIKKKAVGCRGDTAFNQNIFKHLNRTLSFSHLNKNKNKKSSSSRSEVSCDILRISQFTV